MDYRYTVDREIDPDHKDWAFRINVTWSDDLQYIAEEAAEDYHDNHDGWEDTYPLDFFIYDCDFKFLGQVKIEREYEPTFSGSVIKENENGRSNCIS